MKCPKCSSTHSRVVDSRHADEVNAIRRRRECEQCSTRFTTFEHIEKRPLIVVKKDGTREQFLREKILNGLVRSCEKRPVRYKQLEDITNSFKGVDKSFAIQAGREIRIMVVPEQVSDADMVLLARDISKQIEAELEYPGQIKVNVIRESRVIDYAK